MIKNEASQKRQPYTGVPTLVVHELSESKARIWDLRSEVFIVRVSKNVACFSVEQAVGIL
jgi:hypothetical protein